MDEQDLEIMAGMAEIKDAAQLWRFLKSDAGLDLKYYDKQMLDSDDPDLNLYSLLDISFNLPTVEENLAAGNVTLERLLKVLLTAFQPYSMMMNGICRFFAKYEIRYADKNIKMEFDFDSLTEDLRFDLKNFREMITKYHSIEKQVSVFEITPSQISELGGIFQVKNRGIVKNVAAKHWIDSYLDETVGAVFNEPDLETPLTDHPELDRSLEILMLIWRSFVNGCREYGSNLEDLKRTAGWPEERAGLEGNVNVLNDVHLLCQISLDHWARSFIIRLFTNIEEIQELDSEERNSRFNDLSDKLKDFVSNLNKTIVTVSENKVVEQLKDILTLPVWKFRYELYAAWILTKIDESFDGYQLTLHHKNGKLALPFKANLIATVRAAEGDFELWSELRSPLENPSGSKRKAAIQPDYRIFFSADAAQPEKHFAAVEVKQYRTSNKKNFSEAMNDYARGLTTAAIFLVNYGPVKDNMSLDFPDRCTYMGQIRPDDESSDLFVRSLSAVLPLPEEKLPGLEHYLKEVHQTLFFGCPIEEIYIDVSESLNTAGYKQFLKTAVTNIIADGSIKKLSAVDLKEKKWKNPNVKDFGELLEMEFTGGTGFREILNGLDSKKMIITDLDGYRDCVRGNMIIGGCLIYEEKNVDFIPLNSDMWN